MDVKIQRTDIKALINGTEIIGGWVQTEDGPKLYRLTEVGYAELEQLIQDNSKITNSQE